MQLPGFARKAGFPSFLAAKLPCRRPAVEMSATSTAQWVLEAVPGIDHQYYLRSHVRPSSSELAVAAASCPLCCKGRWLQ